ncbi:lantibiotic dehydratase [Kribbella catacumbae]|uniref:lantibiotic dehydratase n=1 Tax=Kribbella catacumbae TaxID=460086 RepID=UPI00146ABD5E|nr:lantibiotic dehydratase [Kribbella catacumbae]
MTAMTLDHRTYRPVNALMLRLCLLPTSAVPSWPQLTGVAASDVEIWRTWMATVLQQHSISGALDHASPDLVARTRAVIDGQVTEHRKVTSAGLSLVQYIARLHGRATPFGLAAGVSTAVVGSAAAVRLGRDHRATARAGTSWLSAVVENLERTPELRPHLHVVANNTVTVRGDRLVVPFQPLQAAANPSHTVEMSLRHTSAVQLALELAAEPIRWDDLAAKLGAEFDAASGEQIDQLLTQLLQTMALLSNLHAPATTVDALQHLVDVLAAAGASGINAVSPVFRQLQCIQRDLIAHNQLDLSASSAIRPDLGGRMTALSAAPRPLAVDTRADTDVALPAAVLREVSAAAGLLTELSTSPFGPPAWTRYAQAFFERYGIGTLVPVLDLVDPDSGLGFPDGYLTATPEPARAITDRDLQLLTMAQTAAVDQLTEIELTPQLVDQLSPGGAKGIGAARHLELTFQLHAASTAALNQGAFELAVTSVSRGIGTVTGRFLPLLGATYRNQLADELTRADVGDVLRVQLSAPPLAAADAHVTRSPKVLPDVIGVAEHRPAAAETIPVSDLAVATDGYQLRLASISRGRWIEPVQFNAIELRSHTPALARFLNELPRAHTAVVTQFDWGTTAGLPYLPRLRRGRLIISPATWRITDIDLPAETDLQVWAQRLTELRAQRRIPVRVLAIRGDQRLPLDLDQISHVAVLRADLARGRTITLTEQASVEAFGWLDGHAHEIVAPLIATTPTRRTTLPTPGPQHVVAPGHGYLPAVSCWMTIKLYGHPARQDEILTAHLPRLLCELPAGTGWWFIRYQDSQPHLRLRLHLNTPDEFGPASAAVSRWAESLRQQRLLRDLLIAPYYAEPGRWGGDAALADAERIFAADSQALLTQLSQPAAPARQAITAANFVAIAAAFTGSTAAAMQWLTDHANAELDQAPPRDVLTTAVRIADPTNDWAGLSATAAGLAIVDSWTSRDHAVRTYRTSLEHTKLNLDEVLMSLLHVHHIRAVGIDRTDESHCLRLARAAALAWTARRKNQP